MLQRPQHVVVARDRHAVAAEHALRSRRPGTWSCISWYDGMRVVGAAPGEKTSSHSASLVCRAGPASSVYISAPRGFAQVVMAAQLLGNGVAEQLRRVLPRDLADLVGVKSREPSAARGLRVGPRGVGVRVVALDTDVVDADVVAQRDRRAGCRSCRTRSCGAARRSARCRVVPAVRADRGVVEHVVDAVDQHRHPADAALGERDLDARGSGSGCAPTASRRRRRSRSPGTGVVYSSSGAPGERAAVHDDEPLCRHTTVSVSSHARRNGSQWSVCIDGSRRSTGFSGKLTALKPRSALRRTSAAAISGSSQPRELQRDDAVGVRAGPLLDVPVVPRAQRRRDRARDPCSWRRSCPRSPAMSDGKHSDAYTPSRSMSATRASMS